MCGIKPNVIQKIENYTMLIALLNDVALLTRSNVFMTNKAT